MELSYITKIFSNKTNVITYACEYMNTLSENNLLPRHGTLSFRITYEKQQILYLYYYLVAFYLHYRFKPTIETKNMIIYLLNMLNNWLKNFFELIIKNNNNFIQNGKNNYEEFLQVFQISDNLILDQTIQKPIIKSIFNEYQSTNNIGNAYILANHSFNSYLNSYSVLYNFLHGFNDGMSESIIDTFYKKLKEDITEKIEEKMDIFLKWMWTNNDTTNLLDKLIKRESPLELIDIIMLFKLCKHLDITLINDGNKNFDKNILYMCTKTKNHLITDFQGQFILTCNIYDNNFYIYKEFWEDELILDNKYMLFYDLDYNILIGYVSPFVKLDVHSNDLALNDDELRDLIESESTDN